MNNYLVNSVGLFDVDTHLDMTSSAAGFGLTGRVAARSRRIDNATIARPARRRRDDHRQDRDGAVRPGPRRQYPRSPRRGCSVTSGGGTYRPNGALDLRLNGVSDAYGPLVVHVTGTAARAAGSRSTRPIPASASASATSTPTVRATAQRLGDPGDRRIRLRPVHRRRRRPLEPRAADDRGQPADLRRASISAAGSSGPRAGPFAGTLTLAGQGLDGTRPARRRRPLPADRRRRHRQWRAHAGRRADHHPARRSSRRRVDPDAASLDRRRRPARRPHQRRPLRPARPASASIYQRRQRHARSCSPKGGAACRSASPPMPRSRPS